MWFYILFLFRMFCYKHFHVIQNSSEAIQYILLSKNTCNLFNYSPS